MKKCLLSLFLLCFIFALSGCMKTQQDQFAAYRGRSAQVLFNSGEKMLAKQDYDNAVKFLEALDALYPFGPYSKQGQLDIIYAYYMDDDDASAIAAADRFTHLYPRDKNVDYAYYMRGVVGFRVGQDWLQRVAHTDPAPRDIGTLRVSFNSFLMVVTYFPGSSYYADSLIRMAYIRNLMARRDMMVAEFYMEREAYIAAVNRASSVVQHYEGSPEVIPALALLVKAYKKLGLMDLSNNAKQILAMSYPNTPDYQKIKGSSY